MGTVMGMNALVLTTIGRKSGVERQTPVGRFPGQDGSWLIVASAAGAAGHPAWYYNLAAHPDQVWIEMAGRKVAVTAEQLHGAGPVNPLWSGIYDRSVLVPGSVQTNADEGSGSRLDRRSTRVAGLALTPAPGGA